VEDRVVVYEDRAGDWRWKRVSDNGRTIADGSEGYENRSDCMDQARKVNKTPYILDVHGSEGVQTEIIE